MWRVLVFAVLAAGLPIDCGEEADEADRERLTATEVEMLAAEIEAVAAAQVAAWNAGDVTAFRQVYTEDIEHHDGQLEMVGLDSIAGMAERMFERYPD